VVKSDSSAVLTATATMYGRTVNVTPPSASAFAVRARLNAFDTENKINPRGSISLTAKEEDIQISIA
jgi:chemotaxis protein CheY-P-specific phosphatase CheC